MRIYKDFNSFSNTDKILIFNYNKLLFYFNCFNFDKNF